MSSAASSGAAPAAATSASADGLDTAKLLLQKVVRAFYGPRGAILIDQLIRKDIFPADELARRLGMQIKDVTKIAHRLLEDQIVHVHRRSEMRDNGFAKAQQRSYYYLDYSKATDVIKWRMWRIQQTIDVKLRNELDAQGYNCPLCKASYTPLDAATLYDPMRNLLACSICQTEVVNKENEEDIRGNKDRMQRLNRQTKGIVDLLKKMERVELPKFDAEAYLLVHGPALGATAAAAAEATGTGASSASVVKIHMAGDDDEANERARRERELQEKRAQNALPSWIAQSTISADPELRRAQEAAQSAEAAQEAEVRGPLSSPERAGRDGLISSSAATAGGATLRMGDDKQLAAGAGEGAEGAGAAPSGDAALDAYYASLAALEEQGTPGLDSTSSGTPAAGLGAFGAVDSPEAGSARAESEQVEPALAEEDAEDLGQSSLGGSKRERETSSPAVGELEQSKRARLSASVGTESPGAAILEEVVETIEGSAEPVAVGEEEEEEEDEEDMDEFEAAAEGDADPNQPVMVNGKEMPFAEVTDDMTGEMTADEYSAYWDVYQRVNS
ncbi:hypothetical protein JCM8202_002167 [Rhodotorula sphaerocarpa]